MIEKVMVSREIEVTNDVVCNCCGKSTKDQYGHFECVEVVACWGYGSTKDNQCHESHICETCYDRIVATFKIPPTVESYM